MATILVVDDEPVLLRVVSRMLCGAGHTVTTAAGGAAALKLIQNVSLAELLEAVAQVLAEEHK